MQEGEQPEEDEEDGFEAWGSTGADDDEDDEEGEKGEEGQDEELHEEQEQQGVQRIAYGDQQEAGTGAPATKSSPQHITKQKAERVSDNRPRPRYTLGETLWFRDREGGGSRGSKVGKRKRTTMQTASTMADADEAEAEGAQDGGEEVEPSIWLCRVAEVRMKGSAFPSSGSKSKPQFAYRLLFDGGEYLERKLVLESDPRLISAAAYSRDCRRQGLGEPRSEFTWTKRGALLEEERRSKASRKATAGSVTPLATAAVKASAPAAAASTSLRWRFRPGDKVAYKAATAPWMVAARITLEVTGAAGYELTDVPANGETRKGEYTPRHVAKADEAEVGVWPPPRR